MAPPGMVRPPRNPNDPGRGPMYLAVTWVFTVLATFAVSLWVYVRRKQQKWLGWDVWLMIVALLSRVGHQITMTISVRRYGLGKHDLDLTPDQLVHILKINWCILPSALVTTLFARISITLLLIRLFGVHKKFKLFLIVTTVVQCLGGIAFLIVTFAQVSPVESLWEIFNPPTRRWSSNVWLITASTFQSILSFSDLTYVLFPIIFIWKLQMPLRRRLGLAIMMCMSLVTMSMSITSTVWYSFAAKASALSTDVQYNASFSLLFSTLEQCLVIIMGCVPSLRNLVNMEMDKISTLKGSLSTIYKRTRSKISLPSRFKESSNYSKQANSDRSSDTYYHLEGRSTSRTGDSRVHIKSHSVVIASHDPHVSDEEIAPGDGQIRRTDQWNVTSFDERSRLHSTADA